MIQGHDIVGMDDQEQGQATFERLLVELSTALEGCLFARCHSAAQILLYSAIDILANLDRPTNKGQGDRNDFHHWVKTYMLVGDGASLPCNERDIYAARCGIVHAMHAESSSSRDNTARMIFLAYKPAELASFQALLDRSSLNNQRAVAVYIDELFASFASGVDRFVARLAADPAKAQLVHERARKIPAYMPPSLFNVAPRPPAA